MGADGGSLDIIYRNRGARATGATAYAAVLTLMGGGTVPASSERLVVPGIQGPFLVGQAVDLSNSRTGSGAGQAEGKVESGLAFYNNLGALTKGTLVYPTSYHALGRVVAKADGDASAKFPVYVVAEDTADATIGMMVERGVFQVASFDTSGSAVGNPVYASGTAGAVTLTNSGGLPLVGRVASPLSAASGSGYVAFDIPGEKANSGSGGVFYAANGSAAAPSVTYATDPDTGTYRFAANSLGFAIGGVSALVLAGSAPTVSAGADTAGQDVYLFATAAGTGTSGAKTGGALRLKSGGGGPAAGTIASGAGGALGLIAADGGAKTGTSGATGAGGALSGSAGAGGNNAVVSADAAGVGGTADFSSGAGGNQTGAAASGAGGAGGAASYGSGAGGNASGAGSTGNGGAGGQLDNTAGTGGTSVGGTGGVGGAFLGRGGAGGLSSTGNGGAGGATTVQSGVGATGVVGGAGGAHTTVAGAGGVGTTTAGAGGVASFAAGAGAAGATTVAGGVGGAATVSAGAGGAKAGTGNAAGGAGGALTDSGGAGGATASSGADAGGAGGAYIGQGGIGGNATAGTGSGGAGGASSIIGAAGGTSAGGSGGAGGAVAVTAGAGGNGSVGGVGGTVTITAGAAGTGGNVAGGNVNLIPGAATGTGLAGEIQVNSSTAGFVPVSFYWVPGSVDTPFFVASRAYRVKSIRTRVEVAGTDGGAVTAIIVKAASGTAITAGTALHTGTIDLKGTAATNQPITLSATASDLEIAAGTCIGIDFTGTLTSAVGTVTVTLAPV